VIGGGVLGVAGDENTIRIGDPAVQTATYIAGIVGATVPAGAPLMVGNDSRLGTITSSRRFKKDIKPMDKASETLLALKPVTFRYKKDIDPAGISQFGLVAEDVEKVNPDLVVRDNEGRIYSVRYDQVNAMLLNEFLKEHRKVQELEKGIAALTAQFKEQAAQIQKVNARIEMNKPPTEMVFNNP
jgi:translation initiation factor IF-2